MNDIKVVFDVEIPDQWFKDFAIMMLKRQVLYQNGSPDNDYIVHVKDYQTVDDDYQLLVDIIDA